MVGFGELIDFDFEANFMNGVLVRGKSPERYDGDYIKLNDLDGPLESNDLFMDDAESELEDGEILDSPKVNVINTRNYDEFEGYDGSWDYGRRIHADCAYNLQFPCMIGYKCIDANFFPILPINVMSRSFYNSIMRNKVEYKGKNVVGAFINVPVFVGCFTIVTEFAVVEDMNAYCDSNMGDVIVGKPFCREITINAKRFEGKITFQCGSDIITYMMPRTHPGFKHATNRFCYKFSPFLFISNDDMKRGIEYPYQMMEGFYNGVLKLGPEYTRDELVAKWILRKQCGNHVLE